MVVLYDRPRLGPLFQALGATTCELWDNEGSQWVDQDLREPIRFSEDGTVMLILRLNEVGHCPDLGKKIIQLENRDSDDIEGPDDHASD